MKNHSSFRPYRFRPHREPSRHQGALQPRRRIILKNPEQIEGIRQSCALARDTLDMLEERVKPGVTTDQIDTWARSYLARHGAIPAPLGYRGYPRSICTSINAVVCHGIPDETVLADGDIVNIDVTAILNGYYGDTSRMFLIGTPSAEARRLVEVTRECLYRGIAQVAPGKRLGDIGWAIQSHAEQNGYSVVEELAGHGVGIEFHEDPIVLHYGTPGQGAMLLPNMTFTIEPMINAGRRHTMILDDGWTILTEDGSLSAQWEHTVRVTQTGVEVLTT